MGLTTPNIRQLLFLLQAAVLLIVGAGIYIDFVLKTEGFGIALGGITLLLLGAFFKNSLDQKFRKPELDY